MSQPQWGGPPGPQGWGPQGQQQQGWGTQGQQQWAPPPPPPKKTSGALIAVVAIAGSCCVVGMLAGKKPTPAGQQSAPAPTQAATPAPAPEYNPPAPPSAGGDLPPGVNPNNTFVVRFFRRTDSTQAARTGIALSATMFDHSRTVIRAAATGTEFENATYETPRCSRAWLARFASTNYTLSDYRETVSTTMRDAGFQNIQCVRSSTESTGFIIYPLR